MTPRWRQMLHLYKAAVVCATVTLAVTLVLARRKHLPSWLYIPSPDMLGIVDPERSLYTTGFLLTAAFFYTGMIAFVQFLLSRVERRFNAAAKAVFVTASLAFLGLAVHAIFPLQKGVLTRLADDEPPLTTSSTSTVIHQAGTSVFFAASWVHMGLVLYLFTGTPRLALFQSRFWLRFKLMCLLLPGIVLLLTIIYNLAHSSGSKSESETHKTMNLRGLVHWVLVVACLCFYGSYIHDFNVLLRLAPGSHVLAHGDTLDNAIELQIPARSLMESQDPSAATTSFDSDPLNRVTAGSGAVAHEERQGLLNV